VFRSTRSNRSQVANQATVVFLALVLCCSWSPFLRAQHCAPILDSYLSSVSLDRTAEDQFELSIRYHKSGGKAMTAYQIYLVAFRARDVAKFPVPLEGANPRVLGETLIDPSCTVILDTKLIRRDDEGKYTYEYSVDSEKLAEKMVKSLFKEEGETQDLKRWQPIGDPIRLAVFVPFLADRKYSNDAAFPQDDDARHECNYGNWRALLIQELPFELSLVSNRDMETLEVPKGPPWLLRIKSTNR
jgi:hypothetical protein